LEEGGDGETREWVSNLMPKLNSRGWTVLLTSILAVVLAATPLRTFEKWGASKVGTHLLYLVLATIGVKTSLRAVQTAPVLCFSVFRYWFYMGPDGDRGAIKKIPLFFLSTASQAAVGGPISAPIVAEVYRPGTAPIGVLMAILAL